jgi:hypothetical protein
VLKPWQFSGWESGDPNRIKSMKIDDADPVVQECINAWKASADTNYAGGAVLYYAPGGVLTEPSWVRNCLQVAQIGGHRFFVPKK